MRRQTSHPHRSGKSKLFAARIAITLGLILGVSVFTGVLFFGRSSSEGFRDFKEIQLYATNFEESPKMDNDNIIKPDYTAFFGRWQRGFFGRIIERLLCGLHIRSCTTWSPAFFKTLLTRVTKLRADAGYKADVILKMAATENTKIVVVGNLQAAFHSLVRNLAEMINLGILDNKLHICKPDHILIFMGNAINRAPYSMETLSVIARLIEENPNTVFYLRGNHEDNNYWHDYTLKQELIAKAAGLSSEKIPLNTEVNAFFATLPLALYIGVPPEHQQNYVRISHEGKDYADLDESKIAAFLRAPLKVKEPSLVEVFNVKDIKEARTDTPVHLAALIRSEKKRKTFQTMDGMRLLTPEEGTVAWTILSCPTKVYQLGVKFFYDAFGIITCGKNIGDWTITLHNQDVRLLQGYATRTCNLLSGSCDKKDPTREGEAPGAEPALSAQQQPTPREPESTSDTKPKKESTKESDAPAAQSLELTPLKPNEQKDAPQQASSSAKKPAIAAVPTPEELAKPQPADQTEDPVPEPVELELTTRAQY